jgi:hypothetical protein
VVLPLCPVSSGVQCVGGGHTNHDRLHSDRIRHQMDQVAMTVINNQLVLVDGREHGHYSKVLGVWRDRNTCYL